MILFVDNCVNSFPVQYVSIQSLMYVKRISNQEKSLIETAQKTEKEMKMMLASGSEVPWKSILTSRPVWGVAAGHLASNWGNYQLNTLLPTYLSTVLQ